MNSFALSLDMTNKQGMTKTPIPSKISSIEEAKSFLLMFHDNGELYHMDMDAHDMFNGDESTYTHDEAEAINNALEACSNIMGYEEYSEFIYHLNFPFQIGSIRASTREELGDKVVEGLGLFVHDVDLEKKHWLLNKIQKR